jgi:hypothetical protein
MTQVERTIEREKKRAEEVWNEIANVLVQEWLDSSAEKPQIYNRIIQHALLGVRAEQIREYAEDTAQHDQYRTGSSDSMVCWPGCPRCELDDLATALETAAEKAR